MRSSSVYPDIPNRDPRACQASSSSRSAAARLQCCRRALVVTLHQLLLSWQGPSAARGAATCASGRSIPGQLHRWNPARSGCGSGSLGLLLLPGRAGQAELPSPLCSPLDVPCRSPWSCAQLPSPPDPVSLFLSINNCVSKPEMCQRAPNVPFPPYISSSNI